MEATLLREKQGAYAAEAGVVRDALRNFKVQALLEGRDTTEVWLTFFLKQVLAITNAVRTDPKAPREFSEGMVSRILDARVYLNLLTCMLVERGVIGWNQQGTLTDDTSE